MLAEVKSKVSYQLKGSYAGSNEVGFVKRILNELQDADLEYYRTRKYSAQEIADFFASIPDALILNETRADGLAIGAQRDGLIEASNALLSKLNEDGVNLTYSNSTPRTKVKSEARSRLNKVGRKLPLDRTIAALLKAFVEALNSSNENALKKSHQKKQGRPVADSKYFYGVIDNLARKHITRSSTRLLERILSTPTVCSEFGKISPASIRQSINRSRSKSK